MSTAEKTLPEIARQIVYLETRARLRMAEWLELIGDFDAREGAHRTGFRGTAEWLAFSCSLMQRTAREHVRVARRLRELPKIAQAFGDGRLSYAQVRAIVRADASENEADLLRVALTSTASALERHVRQLRSSQSADLDTANTAHERRFVTWFHEQDGSTRFFGSLGPADGAAFAEAIATKAETIYGDEPQRPPLRARRADALIDLLTGGGAPQTHLVLHADPDALACIARGEQPRAGAACALEDGPAIPSELARRLTCDAKITLAGLNLGRSTRTVTPAQRRALKARDGHTCVMPGCERIHGLDGHHIRHWVHGGTTDLDNLVLLCRYHHRLFHDDGFTMRRRRDNTLTIRDPAGREIYEVHLGQASRAGPLAVAA